MLLLASNNYARENSAVVAFLKKVMATGFNQKHRCRTHKGLIDEPIGTLLYQLRKRLNTNEKGPHNQSIVNC